MLIKTNCGTPWVGSFFVMFQRSYSYDEVLEALTPPSSSQERRSIGAIAKEPREDWDRGCDYDRSFGYARFGWNEFRSELHRLVLQVQLVAQDFSFDNHWSVSGESVDVARFLSGEPECMLDSEIPQRTPANFKVDISQVGNVSAEDIVNRGIAVSSAVLALQGAGYPVSVEVFNSVANYKEELFLLRVQILELGEYFDVGRMAYWICHPASLRRSLFYLLETGENKDICSSFGFRLHGSYGDPAPPESGAFHQDDIIISQIPGAANSLRGAAVDAVKNELRKKLGIALHQKD